MDQVLGNQLSLTGLPSYIIEALQKTLENYHAKEALKDQTISNLQAKLAYLRQKLFGSSSERRINDFPEQLNLFSDSEEEPIPELIDPEIILLLRTPMRERKSFL